MRLIDADKMKLEVINENPIVVYYSKEIEEWRDSQPTVKAIPIEWIRDYIDFGVSDKLAQHDMRFVSKMIEDWEEENDYNNVRKDGI